MKKLLLALGILALICSPALAGKNAGGALIVHTNDAINYTGTANYCDAQYRPADCETAVTTTNKDDATEALIWFLAAFDDMANPAVTGIQFGVRHNLPPGQGYVAHWGVCGPNPQQLPDAGFPDTPGGNLVGYGAPVMEHLFTFYWFGAYGFDGAFFGTGPYPGDGLAKFADDSVPPVEDVINKFGEVRWYVPGFNECPEPPQAEGACCLPTGECIITPPDQCAGEYLGDGTVCVPNPCDQPAACCFEDGSCADLLETDCVAQGGIYHAEWVSCDVAECPQPPVPAACCFEDGSCLDLFEADCVAQGGIYHPEWETCAVAQCPVVPPTGACCIDGVCTEITESECLAGNGIYFGDGVSCEGVECPVATEPTTWGQIKANYR